MVYNRKRENWIPIDLDWGSHIQQRNTSCSTESKRKKSEKKIISQNDSICICYFEEKTSLRLFFVGDFYLLLLHWNGTHCYKCARVKWLKVDAIESYDAMWLFRSASLHYSQTCCNHNKIYKEHIFMGQFGALYSFSVCVCAVSRYYWRC